MAYRLQYKNNAGAVVDLPLDAETVQGVDVIELLSGASGVQFSAGSYVGTGTYGTSNRTSLTFDFVPKLLIVQRVYAASTYSWATDTMIWLGGSSYVRRGNSTVVYNDIGTVMVSENTVSWYNTVDAQRQLNTSNGTYTYIAIG